MSRKLFNIIHAHLGTDPRKIVEPADRCGFEAWRSLHKVYDPVTTDMAYTLMAALHKISKWTVKGVVEENAAMREAEKRLKELERRVPSTNIDDQKRMVAGMVYENLFSSTTKRYVLSKQQPGDDVPDIRGSFDQLKKAVEELKELEDKSKPVKMELSAAQEKDDYTA